MIDQEPIGIIDSGVGGLSIVNSIRKVMPNIAIEYYADTANFPYGEKTRDEIKYFVHTAIKNLGDKGCKIIILACNTATTITLEQYQVADLDINVLGVTPLLDQALDATKSRKIVVAATFATLASDYYQNIVKIKPVDVTVYALACFEWVRLVEAGDLTETEFISDQVKAFEKNGVDTIVLGCTHFSFLADIIKKAAPSITIIEPSTKIAGELKTLLGKNASLGNGRVNLTITGNAEKFMSRAVRLSEFI